MICAHTIRRLNPGAFEEFVETFSPPADAESTGWVSFHVLRGIANEDEVITFGFFDGTLEQLEQSQEEHGYRELREQIEPLVEQVIANGLYEVVQSRTAASEAGA